MLAFFYLMGAGFSSFFLLLVVINSVNSSDSFLDNFVITCKFFFSISFVTGLICTFYFCVRGFLTAIGIGVMDSTMTCSSLADMDKRTFRCHFPIFLSAIAETLNIFLRISYPPLKLLKNSVTNAAIPPTEITVESSPIFFLRGLISNLSLATKFYSSSRRPLPIVF